MATTQAAIVARIKALIEALDPTSDIRVRFESSRNEGAARFIDEAEGNVAGALRRFQARPDGKEEPPENSDTLTDLRHFTVIILVAYPHTGRYGDALARAAVIDEDWGKINGKVGIYSRASYSGGSDCTPLGATDDTIIGANCDFLEVTARFSHYRNVS